MSFKQAIEIEKIKEITDELFQSVLSIEEYGHCAIPSSEYPKLKIRSEELIKKLKECEEELGKFQDEMVDWYSY